VTFLGDAPSDGGWIFDVNPDLDSVTVPTDATGFGDTFSGVTVSFAGNPIHPVFTTSDNGDGTVTITGCTANCAGDLVIPETISGNTVTVIGHHSLDQLGLTSVTIPNSVTSIEDSAFQKNQLTSVSIPNSVKSIGFFSFFENQLAAVTIPESVSSIGGLAFMSNALATVTFLGDAPSGAGYFANNPNLLSIVVPSDAIGFGTKFSGIDLSYTGDPIHAPVFTTSDNGDGTVTITGCTDNCSGALVIPGTIDSKPVTVIGEMALFNCRWTSVTIPNSVTNIEKGAFSGNSIASVTIPDSVTNIGDDAFLGNELTTVNIPNSVTNVGDGAFEYNKLTSITISTSMTHINSVVFAGNQLSSVTIPNSVVSIGYRAFYANHLSTITIPSHVTAISAFAFCGNQLTSVVIPESVTRVGEYAFGTNALTSVTFLGDAPDDGGNAFNGSNDLLSVIVPSDATGFDDTFSGVTVSRTGIRIHPPVFTTSDNADGTLTLTGCSANCSGDVTIPEQLLGKSVTVIGAGALGNKGMTSVIIPNSVIWIGDEAFNVNPLTSVSIGTSVIRIGNFAFDGNLLTSVAIPNSVASIGNYAFASNSLTSVAIPNSVSRIGNFAFADNTLTSVAIPNSVSKIGNYAFAGNHLTSVTIPDSVNTIGDSAFGSNSLTSVTIPDSVNTIGDWAFSDNALTSVSIGTSVVRIGQNAFSNNPLTSVILFGDAPIEGGDLFLINGAYSKLGSVIVPSDAIGFGTTFSDVPVRRTGPAIHTVTPTPTPTPTVAPIAPKYSSGEKITGKAKVGNTLIVKPGKWKGGPKISYTYQWYTCSKAVKSVVKNGKAPGGCKAISKATKPKLKLTAKQKKSHIAVLIAATNGVKTVKIFTASLGPVK
jgi:hypothetical protein